ncbi:MAG: HD domain-containing protein [Sandaracinaceae bacterium]|nr:HD domain-containing protein [Sandaracinaceae bacterium]
MILRDPIHGLVAFEGDDERVVTSLLATREVQRLRRVRQLGLTSLVFPGAEHSRFAHAIGAAHVMVRLAGHLAARQHALPPELRLDDESRRDAVAAALLHDVGHGPFSHLFEEVVPEARAHESWTVEVLREPASEVHRALEALSSGMAERVACLLTGEGARRWLGRTISGTLDVDRCDYLLRDSQMTGVRYGLYDLDWLLRALVFAEVPGHGWVLAIEGRKGLPPIESFFLARQFMYQQVYHHKATRAAECLIHGMFRRLAQLIREGAAPAGTPEAVRRAVLGQPLGLGAYLALDDPSIMTCIAAWEDASDPLLADFAARLLHRRLPKTIPLPEGPEARWLDAKARADEVARARGLDPELTVWLDVPDDTPYAEPTDVSAEGLWVVLSKQPLRRLGEVSFLLRQLRNQTIVRPRLVFPEAIRAEVEAAVEEVFVG